jgi:photosystem II stability/assembly factor-like uncharacterized protein
VLIAATALAAFCSAQEPSRIHQSKLTPQNSGTSQGLIAVSPVNPRVVWASGRGGTFVLTTDGGKHWKSGVVPGAEALQFRDVQGFSEKVAYLQSIGENPTDFRIYKTVDGGANWTMQFQNQNPGAFYDCFAFWTPKRGISHSDSVNGVFPDLRTTNGTTWQDISSDMPPALSGEFSFASSARASRPKVQETPDYNRRWRRRGSLHPRWRQHPNAYDTPLLSSPSAGGFTLLSAIPGTASLAAAIPIPTISITRAPPLPKTAVKPDADQRAQ